MKLARPTQTVVWSRPQGNVGHGEVRGVAISQAGPGYVFAYRIWNGASQVRFTDANGIVTREFSSLERRHAAQPAVGPADDPLAVTDGDPEYENCKELQKSSEYSV